MENLDLALRSLKASGAIGLDHDLSFTESEFATHAQIPLEKVKELVADGNFLFLNVSNLTEVNCDCGSRVELSPEIPFAYCQNCKKKINLENQDRFILSLNQPEIESTLLKETKQRLTGIGNLIHVEQNRWLIKKEDLEISVFLALGEITLDRYFELRGWQARPSDCFVLIGERFSPELLSYTAKDPRCNCFSIPVFFEKRSLAKLFKTGIKKARQVIEDESLEQTLKYHSEEHANLLQIKAYFQTICEKLLLYGKQQDRITSSKQGREFQKYIAALFQLSLFRTKLLGGGNEPDALGYLFPPDKKKIWCPFEIKSSKAEIFSVSDESLQVRKYCSALSHSIITQSVDVRFFILIANDFEENSQEDEKILNKLKIDFPKYRFIRFPLKSVIKMAQLFIIDPPLQIVPESIESFFESTPYVTEEKITQLHTDLKCVSNADTALYKQLRKTVSAYGVK